MIYNFDEIIERKSTYAEKYCVLGDKFGREDVIPLWVADMDFRTARPVTDALNERVQNGIFGYTVRPDSYYDAVCRFQKKRKNWDIDKNLISSSIGVVPSISMIIKELTAPDDMIIIQTPVYHPFYNAVKYAPRELLENPLKEVDGHFYMDFDDLEEKARKGAKFIVLCSPHNPVGRVWKKEELQTLGNICLKHGIRVISDEIHSDLILWGNKHIPFASVSEEFRKITITCVSASKTFNLAGLQSSVTIFPDVESKNKFEEAWAKLHLECNNCLSIAGTQAAYENGEEWLDQLINYLEGNVNYVLEFIKKYIPGIKPVCPEGTYLIWLDCRQLGMSGEQLERFMIDKAGIAMTAGTYFGENGEGFMRMNIACPRSILKKAMEQLQAAVNDLKK